LKTREDPGFEGHQARENNFFEVTPSHYEQVAANNMVINADNFPKDINIVDKEDLMFHQNKLLDKTGRNPKPMKRQEGDSAFRRALDDIEVTIAFNNAAVLEEADDSLCTDESMNDI
jgi:hypothetical protein